MGSIKYFLYLLKIYLGVNSFWIIIILILYIISKLYPYHLKGKSVTTDENGNKKETKYFEYKDF